MNVATSYPGVYVQEVPSGVRPIAGVSTSVTMFIGACERGPIDTPTRFFNYTDFARTFGESSAIGDMARYLKLFFLNGGTDCYVMRIADQATPASVQIQSEGGANAVLTLTAKQVGKSGDLVRARVSYDAALTETGFNLEIWREEGGAVADSELFRNLTMDPNSPLYAVAVLNQQSKLVTAAQGVVAGPAAGFSQAGRPLPYTAADAVGLRDRIEALLTGNGTLRLSVAGNPAVNADLSGALLPQVDPTVGPMTANDVLNEYANRFTAIVNTALTPFAKTATASFQAGPTPPAGDGDASALIRITADDADAGVIVSPATDGKDMAVRMMMGVDQGGLEVGAYAADRPAPNGLTLDARTNFDALMALAQNDITQITLPEKDGNNVNINVDLVTTAAADPLYRVTADAYPGENADGLRTALGKIRDAINTKREEDPGNFLWEASLSGYRLSVFPRWNEGNLATGTLTSAGAGAFNINAAMTTNVKHVMLGTGGILGLQVPGVAGFDGNPPTKADYEAAFVKIDSKVDIFNLMVLPPTAGSGLDMKTVYGPASVFCQQRRAFLLMDSPVDWTTAQAASTGVAALKIGLVKDHAAVFHPRVQINEGGRNHYVGASGAMAGLITRIDGSRGIWKAPAGTEADIRGISGVEYPFSDMENGVMNPRAVDVIRQFPNGIVSWGARTLDGDDTAGSEYKYIPIRRLALYIEESLYRGLKWTVFEPNDEPLWGQIRLNAGAFMHQLFRNGAFQGQAKKDAYFVKCDSETTNATDQNLGRVNVWIGFAPLKPAEFVILQVQQMAGKIET